MIPRRSSMVIALGWLVGLWTSIAGPSAVAGDQPDPAPAAKDRCVVLVSLDGFAQFSLDDPKSDIPTLRRMVREGAVADGGMTCSFPTVTWPNHTTLVTGVTPARHGVLANSVFDREKGEVIPLLVDPVLDKDQIVRVPTVYDAAHEAGLVTAGVVWPATRRAKGLDRVLPDMGGDQFEAFSTPAWLDELRSGAADRPLRPLGQGQGGRPAPRLDVHPRRDRRDHPAEGEPRLCRKTAIAS